MKINRKELADIMEKYNLEAEINEQFRRLKDLISLGCNDEGELLYNVEDYWEFVWAYLVGLEMGKEKGKKEAKGIIKDLLHCLPKENIEGVYEVAEEAEQFLSEV